MTEKEKYLASAQKHVLKGSYDRAVKDYEQLVALDPQDLRLRQRLAELLARVSRKDEAIREYETIGRFYADNAYHLKAIAVYKQIQKLVPADITIALTLATLNEKQGLKGNALAEYQAVLRQYEAAREFGEATRVLEKMLLLDPDSIELHVRLAETCLSANFRDRAYHELLRTALVCSQQHDDAGFNRVCERIREIFPEQKNFVLDLAQEQVRGGQADEAIIFLQALLDQDDSNMTVWNLLADAYNAAGDWENVKDTYSRMTVLFPNDLAARDKLLSCCIIEENVDEALNILDSCLSFFPSEQLAPLERSFVKVIQMAPASLRPLLGLRDLYEKTGALDKLADVEQKLEILRKSRSADELTPPVSEETATDNEADVASVVGDPEKVVEVESGEAERDYGDVAVREATVDVPSAPGLTWDEVELSLDDELLRHAESVLNDETADVPTGVALDPEPQHAFGDVAPPKDSVAAEPLADAEWGSLEFAVGMGSATPEPASPTTLPQMAADGDDLGEIILTLEEPALEDSMAEIPDFGEPADPEPSVRHAELPEIELTFDDDLSGVPFSEMNLVVLPGDEPVDFGAEAAVQSTDAGPPVADISPDDWFMALSDEIGELPEPAPVPPPSESSELSALRPPAEDLGSAYRKGLDDQIDREDTESHYNLGIAFKEMGLYPAAVEEFRISARNPKRRVDSLLLQGICLKESGNRLRACDIFYAALEEGGATLIESASIRYELALMAEQDGDQEGACRFFREIQGDVPGFRDVTVRMKKLECAPAEDDDLDILDLEEAEEA